MNLHATTTPGKKRLRSSSSAASTSTCASPEIRQASVASSGELLGGKVHEWDAMYNRRALLARIVLSVSVSERANKLILGQSFSAIQEVKFFTRHSFEDGNSDPEIRVFRVEREPVETKQVFEEQLTLYSGVKFPKPTDLPDEYLTLRNEVKNALTSCRMEYTSRKQDTDGKQLGWNCLNDVSDLPKLSYLAELIVSSVQTAFKLDMRNGDAKGFFNALSSALGYSIDHQLPHVFVKMRAPALNEGCNSKVELVSSGDKINYNRPYCESSNPRVSYYGQVTGQADDNIPRDDLLIYPCHAPKSEVADFIWSTWRSQGTDGFYLLNVEIKPDGSETEGLFQCYKQLISKLHFQDFGIGLMITPLRYYFILAYKDGDAISMSRYMDIFARKLSSAEASTSGASNRGRGFNVDNFGELMDMLARILLYAKNLKNKVNSFE